MRPKKGIPLQHKLFLLFSAVILVPLTLCGLLLYRQAVSSMVTSIGTSYTARLDFFADNLKRNTDRMYQDMLNIAVDRNVREALYRPLDTQSTDHLEDYNYLVNTTRNLLFVDNTLDSICIYAPRGGWLLVNTNLATALYNDSLEELDWVETARDENSYSRLVATTVPQTNRPTAENGNKILAQYIPLIDASGGEPYGYLSINLDPDTVQKDLLWDFRTASLRNVVIVDGDGNRLVNYGPALGDDVVHEMAALAQGSGTSGYYTDKVGGSRVLVTHTYMPAYGWKVLVVTDYQEAVSQISGISRFVFAVFAAFFALGFVLAYLLSRSLLQPLTALFSAMQQVRDGKLGTTIDQKRNDEIGQLYEGFNEMSLSLENVLEQLYREELAKKDIQLKMLSHQINAHFLYNTLDAIHWIARIHKVGKISSLVSALANYFRITLSEGQDMIPLSEVVSLAENYMEIYTIKSDFAVDFHIDIPAELYKYHTLKYIFQPLLENALNHGIDQKAQDGEVWMACRKEDEALVFTIRDTGAGIAPDKLAELQHVLQNTNITTKGNFALRNISLQIKLHYGKQYGVQLQSTLGEGTTATIRVPAREEDHV